MQLYYYLPSEIKKSPHWNEKILILEQFKGEFFD